MDANLAVLIDFENVAAGTEKEGLGRFDIDAVLQRVKEKGRVLIARSYADWGRFARFKQSLLMANVTMYELTSHGMQDKNRADIAMVVDALELAFTKDYIDTFVIVSGDSDFTPLVLKMREMNKRVIGIGTRCSTSRLLIHACDEFIFYDTIVADKRRARRRQQKQKDAPSSKEAAYGLLVQAVEGLLRENSNSPSGSVVKGALLRNTPDFSESDYGFGTWSRFLNAAGRAGHIKLTKNERRGGFYVSLPEGDSDSDSESDVDMVPRSDGPWVDPYCPNGMEWVFQVLFKAGYNPLAAPTRMTVLEALENVVAERRKRKRRNYIQFVREDVRRRLSKTHPDLPARALRNVFDALMNVHVFMHRDGSPVRTPSAPFELQKDAEAMNQLLTGLYLSNLKSAGADLSNTEGLADLFLGNPERKRSIQESLAWLDQPFDDDLLLVDGDPSGDAPSGAAPSGAAPSESAPEASLDSVLEISDDDLFQVADTPSTEEAPKAEEAPTEEATPATEEAPTEEAPAKKKPVRKRKPAVRKKKPVAAKAEEAALDDDLLLTAEEPEEKPKPKRRRTTKKKVEAAPAADAADDLLTVEDAPAEAEKPVRKPRRRRTTKKATTEEPTES